MKKLGRNKYLYGSISSSLLALIIIADLIYYYKYDNFQSFLGVIFIVIAFAVFLVYCKKDILNPVSVYSIFWLGVAGISTFKVSYYQQNWSAYMWLIVIFAYLALILGFKIFNPKDINLKINRLNTIDSKKLYISIKILTVLAVLGFLIEVALLKEIPLFSKSMGAYRNFNITGIHYFVVSIGIIPALTILYKKIGGEKKILWINIASFAVSSLILSRQLLIMQIVLVIISYHYLKKKISIKKIGILLIIGLTLFSFSFKLRNQNSEYINSVADIMPKYQKSMLIKPLLYFNMNFTNLNIIVNNFNDYKLGQNMIFPILAFTNLKDEFNYSYKQEYLATPNFNTTTYLADIYFDFGIFGVLIIPFILGIIYSYLYKNIKNKISLLNMIYFLLDYCLIFCFFVNWYYNTAIIFDIIVIFIIYKYSEKK